MWLLIAVNFLALSTVVSSLDSNLADKSFSSKDDVVVADSFEGFDYTNKNALEATIKENDIRPDSTESKKNWKNSALKGELIAVCGTNQNDEEIITLENNAALNSSNKDEGRFKRFVRGPGKWKQRRLKYNILSFTEDLSRSQVDVIIKRSLDLWASYTNLQFEETLSYDEAQIRISFETGSHGDGIPFLPKTSVLAHASYPTGKYVFTHFNDAFRFTDLRPSVLVGIFQIPQLYNVAVHEFGHNLGLAHCRINASAVMCSNALWWRPELGLHPDDIAGIQSIYGKKRNDTKRRRKPSVNICSESFSFDAIHFDYHLEALYGFKGRFYWKINDFGVMTGYPKRVRYLWKGFPRNISASLYSIASKKTYFFKENMVWRYKDGNLDRGFPKNTSDYMIPSNVDAAISLGKRDLYVIKGNHAYRFDESRKGKRRNRKRLNSLWPGAPSNIDAAIRWRDGNIYLFKNNRYWQFPGQRKSKDFRPFAGWDTFKGILKPQNGTFPKNVQRYWVGCYKKQEKTQPKRRRFTFRIIRL